MSLKNNKKLKNLKLEDEILQWFKNHFKCEPFEPIDGKAYTHIGSDCKCDRCEGHELFKIWVKIQKDKEERIKCAKKTLNEIYKLLNKEKKIMKNWILSLAKDNDHEYVYQLTKIKHLNKNKIISIFIFHNGIYGGEIIDPKKYAPTSEKYFKELKSIPNKMFTIISKNREKCSSPILKPQQK